MEKKRRARINDSLDALKKILLNNREKVLTDPGLLESLEEQHQLLKTTKLEKADILEMTVNYLTVLHRQMDRIGDNNVSSTSNKKCTTTKDTESVQKHCEKCELCDKENIGQVSQNRIQLRRQNENRGSRSAFRIVQQNVIPENRQPSSNLPPWRPWRN